MIKIIAQCPNIQDATSLYRGAGPFGNLRKQMPNLSVQFPEMFTWVTFKSADILFMQRPSELDHLKIIEMAKGCNVPVWLEIDDDLFNVPPQNPAFASYIEPERRKRIETMYGLADLITTASEELATSIRAFNKNVVVIENAFDETWLKNHDPLAKTKDKDIVFWRGSDSHIKDLMSVHEHIISISQKRPEVLWRFSGYLPWFICENVSKSHHIKAQDPVNYFNYMRFEANHQTAIVPLIDDPLNRCKSNIAWQENTLAGAAVLAPNMPHWQIPGIINYTTQDEFQAILEEMLQGTHKGHPLDHYVKLSLSYIQENLTLTKINKLRIQCIDTLMSL